MKKITSVLLLGLCIASLPVMAQTKLKEGVVKFTMEMDENASGGLAMLGGSTVGFYFNDKTQKMDISMMSGLIRTQIIASSDAPKDATLLLDMMGAKYQITGLDDAKTDGGSNSPMGMFNTMGFDNITGVVYDKKDTKKIIGYECYKATATMKDGSTIVYYISEKIQPPKNLGGKNTVELKGFPLRMDMDIEGMKMTFIASEVVDKVPAGSFDIPEGYTKKSFAEFAEEFKAMGGGNMQ